MGEIKSAFEKAMEKVEKLGKPSREELLRWKYVPEGQKLAADYLRGDANLAGELHRYGDEERHLVIEGVEEILLRSIGLPVHEAAKRNNKRAMDGIKAIKRDKGALENVYTTMRRVFEHYEREGERQRAQAYESLKQSFQARIQQVMQRQGGLPPGTTVNVETQPQFQDEWRRLQAQIDSQYHKLLDEYKQEIAGIR
ncbi:MAG: hypothetical protein DRI39_04020 [Chloroflexi bacterium]|nr:MAG: hypothetical protein DRI39_04020 [Chloroflexota bacterium]RLC96470.1 MAG: hypothetical protein DRI40_03035 [Chloroflexota bacterium]